MIDVRILVANMNEYFDSQIKMLTDSILSPLAHEDYVKQVGSVHALQKSKQQLNYELQMLIKKAS